MLELGNGPLQHMSQFFDAQTFGAVRLTCKKFRSALNVNHESYYFARVKDVSHFRLKKDSMFFKSYKDIFEKINNLFTIEGNIYNAICSSKELIELTFMTRSLLDKLFTDTGPTSVLNFLRSQPSYYKYIFQNVLILQRFQESDDCWVSTFIGLLSCETEIYNGLLESDEMMATLALSCRDYCHDHSNLCKILGEKYQAPQAKIDAVLHLKTHPIEIEAYNEERAEAIYDLLKSMKPFEGSDVESQVVSCF